MARVKGFIFDYSKCVGCHACIVACYAENSISPPMSLRQVIGFNKQKLPLLGFVHLSIACNHCKEAPCLRACPSGAYKIDDETKAVIHSPELCLGCRYCTWACPFDAPKYNAEKGIVEKCHFCYHKLKVGEIPACALNCPTGALSFGDIEEKPSPEAFGLSQKEIYPRIKVLGHEVKDAVPLNDSNAVLSEKTLMNADPFTKQSSPVGVLNEWPLALFTFIGALLVGWLGASTFNSYITLSPWLFAVLGAIGMIVSTTHLGKPLRAYLSIVSIKTSWLSREIMMFGLFMISGFFALYTNLWWLTVVAAIVGVLFLISVEMLYFVTRKKGNSFIYSGNTIAIALVFASLFAMQWDMLIALLALKVTLFVINKGAKALGAQPKIALVVLVRLVVGFVIPFGAIVFSEVGFSWFLFLFIVLGEIIDRFMFYNDFEPESLFN